MTVRWGTQYDFSHALERSRQSGKPVLLDLYSPECGGYSRLEREVYSDAELAAEINSTTTPIRVNTTNPDRVATDIINNHIFIWSPTIQLLAPDATRYHEWNGAPRRTRLSVGYESVFHDTPGRLDKQSFLAQLRLGMGKTALRQQKHQQADVLLSEVARDFPSDEPAMAEVSRWRDVARRGGRVENSVTIDAPLITRTPLAQAVERLARVVAENPDDQLMADWVGKPGKGDWKWYSDCLREIALQSFQELCDLAVHVNRERRKLCEPVTDTHQILGQHRQAYRDFQSLFVGVPDALMDVTPLRSERSIRENLAHVIMAEWWAYRPQILNALHRGRAGLPPEVAPAVDTVERFGEPIGTHETLRELLATYERIHLQNAEDYTPITDDELQIRSAWWELGPVELRFRLKRYVWHPYDHAVSIDKILDAGGHKRTATHRFASRLMAGLGTAEAALVGATDGLAGDRIGTMTTALNQRADEAAQLLN